MNNTNDYSTIATAYARTHDKPDKKYSMAPMMRMLVAASPGLRVLDVGCGDGFFSRLYAADGATVVGFDNEPEQIARARALPSPNIEFVLADMRAAQFTDFTAVSAPFVLNYSATVEELRSNMRRFVDALTPNGRVVLLCDMPRAAFHDGRAWGAVKRVDGGLHDGNPLTIELWNGDQHLTTLHSQYYTEQCIRSAALDAGCRTFQRVAPIVSPEGFEKFGKAYWDAYRDNLDISYFVAQK